ncbi:MAG: aldehyde dehydrogenase family protein [Mesorhizobium sp.]|uniref:aldehyde dehydrogenase family protein n=1 Tax=Mesorhizobium sp. TaxID=1871066 RepID=UPI000FE5C0BE|nr:aldehyde dehydrogenase family protein [Mesorhizobium sp.]RWF86838.1 MAG: aldehyde dehydrogenase family protein [Mesorhizobium sp.]RWJ55702.1 MAG: aldehyde dehydrogenase family protein [Mesorhizobium sp.]RWJ63159.1 MAG: aldehyde dehydrogenase family protein [Mesorhizobium sp.]RWJ91201.1 MAG: aldehyde dehydrogenase family protein [Mesorhizobium sp.]
MFGTEVIKNFIDGKWKDSSSGKRIEVDDPSNGETIAAVAEAGQEEVDLAVAAANRVFRDRILIDMHPYDRGRMLFRVADALEARSDEIARINCIETGKALDLARGEVGTTVRYLRYYGGLADKVEGRSIPRGAEFVDYTVRSPFGVSAQIVPWNGPLELTARSLACAIATGNSVVVKSPELSPLSGVELARACEAAGVPDGAVNVLTGYGHTAGQALIQHPDVRHIVFTGSPTTGRAVLKAAAERIVPCIMELGGKSAAVVYADADLDAVVEAVRIGTYLNAGQNCNNLTRLIVERSIANELLDRVKACVEGLSVGPGLENFDITPMISQKQRQAVEGACQVALSEGARIVTGGAALSDRSGYFMAATVFADVKRESNLFQKEVFGPVLAVTGFDDPASGIELANDTDQGLAAGVFTRDIDRALWCADRLWAGQVYVNGWYVGGVETPFGGVKQSGYGREKGQEALDGYVQTRNIGIRISQPTVV